MTNEVVNIIRFFGNIEAKDITMLHVIEYIVAVSFGVTRKHTRAKNHKGKFYRDHDYAIPRYVSIGFSRILTKGEKNEDNKEFISLTTIKNYWECDHATVLHHAKTTENTWIIDFTYGEIVRKISEKLEGGAHIRLLNDVRNDKKAKLPKNLSVYVPRKLIEWYSVDSLCNMEIPGVGFLPCYVDLGELYKTHGTDAKYTEIRVTNDQIRRETDIGRDKRSD